MALDGDGGRHDRHRGLPADRNALVAWTGREDNDYRFRELDFSTLAVLLLYALGWIGRN
jgi:hypothetical protein